METSAQETQQPPTSRKKKNTGDFHKDGAKATVMVVCVGNFSQKLTSRTKERNHDGGVHEFCGFVNSPVM